MTRLRKTSVRAREFCCVPLALQGKLAHSTQKNPQTYRPPKVDIFQRSYKLGRGQLVFISDMA